MNLFTFTGHPAQRSALCLLLTGCVAVSCGAGSYHPGTVHAEQSYGQSSYPQEPYRGQVLGDMPASSRGTYPASMESSAGWDASEEIAGHLAQAPGPVVTTVPVQPQPSPTPAEQRTDVAEPLLIYTAVIHLSVFQVEQSQQQVVAIAQELGGFLSRQDDVTVVIRVPAAQFQQALDRVEQVGDVIHRQVDVLDISEEFTDLNIRLRNAIAMRDRLEALLERAQTVADALQIERELQRLTAEIESMRGRLRFLEDRLAYSTITVAFQPRRPSSGAPELFRLPFPWIYELGLPSLLNLW